MDRSSPALTTQQPPTLANQFLDDWLLQGLLGRLLPAESRASLAPEAEALGEAAGNAHYRLQLADRLNEPRLTRWDAWGRRIDHIELTRVWQEAQPLAARHGLVARGYEKERGACGRLEQFALAYLFIPSTDFYGCPLAMTDGAARVLAEAGNTGLAERALPRLISRDPERFWTSGQWMTETVGGSDVSNTETVARQDETGHWRLYGRKWFTSAATSQMALTLARPAGGEPGSRGLALFYLETRDEEGALNNIEILRLKDKLGTRKVPTAELMLRGVPAEPVAGLDRGVASIAPMLNITRTWNAVTACSLMRRGLALAEDYAHKRQAFGRPIIEHRLHRATLADLKARWAAATCLVFEQVRLLGLGEHRDPAADPELLRILTPITKLGTGKEVIAVISEVLECFGGAGYVEDTGLPTLLRDAQVLSIWEGTTNVLALDLVRALSTVGVEPWVRAVDAALAQVHDPGLLPVVRVCRDARDAVTSWLRTHREDPEPGARGLALTLHDTLALAALARHAQWAMDHQADPRPLAAARVQAGRRINHLGMPDENAIKTLLDNRLDH